MTTATIAEVLGGTPVLGHEVRSPLEWVEALAGGLPVESLERAIGAGILTREEADDLVLPRRTLSHRKQKDQPLTREESDRLGRIARLTARAAETLGTPANAAAWLRAPNGALGGQVPLQLLRSGEGAVLVETILTRIDHGVYT